jgi:VWFA-related protein
MKSTTAFLVSLILVVGLRTMETGAVRQQPPSPQQQQPTFRAGTTIVPLNVTVLDKNGKPITDLKAEDFTILESDIPQKLSVFATQSLVPEPLDPELPASPLRTSQPAGDNALAPQHRRVFLLVLGYGRLQEPTKAVDATLTFLRERLLPQDLVSVLLFDRATDFTVDHEYVTGVVENYKKQHEKIIGDVDAFTCAQHGPAGPLGIACRVPPISLDEPPELPAVIQARIDALFDVPTPSAPGPSGTAPDLRHVHNVRDFLFGTREFKQINAASYSISWDLLTTRNDRLKEFAGLEYLRYLDDEKRMVVLVPNGLGLGSVQSDERFAARANAARVTLDLIHTGGMPPPFAAVSGGAPAPRSAPRPDTTPRVGGGGCMGGRCGMIAPARPITDAGFFWNAASSERVAELTGGQFLGTVYADKTFARIDATSRFEYLLGYVPSRPLTDATYRKVVVKVNRPGVTVLFRHGYQPGSQLAPLDVEALVSSAQLEGGGAVDRPSTDIALTLKVLAPPPGASGDVIVNLKIDAARVSLQPTSSGHYAGSLQIQILCGDAKENVVGSVKDRLSLDLSEDARARALSGGIAYSARIPVTGQTRYVKAVVYDFGADLLGTATFIVK